MKTLKLSGSRGGAASAFLAVAFATLGLQGTASAQGVTSVIRGTITDASGAVVQAAALTVTDVTKAWSRMTISGCCVGVSGCGICHPRFARHRFGTGGHFRYPGHHHGSDPL